MGEYVWPEFQTIKCSHRQALIACYCIHKSLTILLIYTTTMFINGEALDPDTLHTQVDLAE